MRVYLQLYPFKPDGETTVLHYLEEHGIDAIVDSSHNVDGLYTVDETSDLKFAVDSFNKSYNGKYFISIIFRAEGNQPLPDSKIIGNKNYKPKTETVNDEKDFPKPPPPVVSPVATENENSNAKKENKNLINDANKVLKKDNNALIIVGGLLAAWLLFSCSSLQKTSAEISISSAEKVLEKFPENSDKEIVRIALKQSKKELREYSETTKELSKKKEHAEKIAQSKSETAGKWEGIRNVFIFILVGAVVFLGFKIFNKLNGVSLWR